MAEYLYHLVPQTQWEACKQSSTAYFPSTYQQDGFIHLTKEPHLLLPVANHFYTDVPGVFLVLKINSGKLSGEVKFEAAAPVGEKPTTKFADDHEEDTVLFPHLYGTIDFEAVEQELGVERGDDGSFLLISQLE